MLSATIALGRVLPGLANRRLCRTWRRTNDRGGGQTQTGYGSALHALQRQSIGLFPLHHCSETVTGGGAIGGLTGSQFCNCKPSMSDGDFTLYNLSTPTFDEN